MSRQRIGLLVALGGTIVIIAMLLMLGRSADALKFVLHGSTLVNTGPVLDPFLIELEERTFRFFWDTANPKNGLVPDRYPTPSFASVAAVGFALTSYPVGVERGYVTREAAKKRVLATLRFFRNAPQGPQAHGTAGYKGFFYHFLDMKTGERFEETELSTVDTALLLAGALFCQSYFDRADAEETEIRQLVEEIYNRVDWHWAQPRAPAISLGWSPEESFLEYDWRGYNEAMLVYLLALGSPRVLWDRKRGQSGRARTTGAGVSSSGRNTWVLRRSLAINIRTFGWIFATSRMTTCAGEAWIISRTVAAPSMPSKPTLLPIRGVAKITAPPCGVSRPATGRRTSSSSMLANSGNSARTRRAGRPSTTIARWLRPQWLRRCHLRPS